jgi:hypothetical protein
MYSAEETVWASLFVISNVGLAEYLSKYVIESCYQFEASMSATLDLGEVDVRQDCM